MTDKLENKLSIMHECWRIMVSVPSTVDLVCVLKDPLGSKLLLFFDVSI